jgi:GNAT superfamily N-acetyltransferase
MQPSSSGPTVRRLNEDDNIAGFYCTNTDLNNFLKEDALKSQSNMTSVTYLCFLKDAPIGFVTLAAATIEVKSISGPPLDGYTPKTYPCIKLARMAIDEKYAGKGYGYYLMLWTMGKFEKISKEIGCRYLTVDSKSESIGFYEKNDFILVQKTVHKSHPTLYLDMYSQIEGAKTNAIE